MLLVLKEHVHVNTLNKKINCNCFLTHQFKHVFWVLKRNRLIEYPQHMFWMTNKESSFPIRTLIWRPALVVFLIAYDCLCSVALFTSTEDHEF